MTAIWNRHIDQPSAWTCRELGGKGSLLVQLASGELDAIDELLQRTRHLPPQQITRAVFDHPLLNARLAEIRHTIMHGRGVVVVRGVTPERYSEDAFERIYWGFGTHLGVAATQSAQGDRLGYVENKPGDKHERGYRSLQELRMHTDSFELVGLMSVRRAESGGVSGMVSSLAIHNEILRTRPELLPALYRGYRYASGEARFTSKPITDLPIPIYTAVDGRVSCIYERLHIDAAAALFGTPLPDDLAEAMRCFDALAVREDLALRFLLEPGEMMLWHNYTNLHSRTAFEDSPQHRRKLLRLWLNVPDGRPSDPTCRTRAETYERIYRDAAKALA